VRCLAWPLSCTCSTLADAAPSGCALAGTPREAAAEPCGPEGPAGQGHPQGHDGCSCSAGQAGVLELPPPLSPQAERRASPRQAELQKHQLEDRLEGRLERRPEREELERRGILKDQAVAPGLQDSKASLERSQLEVSCAARRGGRREGRGDGLCREWRRGGGGSARGAVGQSVLRWTRCQRSEVARWPRRPAALPPQPRGACSHATHLPLGQAWPRHCRASLARGAARKGPAARRRGAAVKAPRARAADSPAPQARVRQCAGLSALSVSLSRNLTMTRCASMRDEAFTSRPLSHPASSAASTRHQR
jgi:hypothetical protein